MSTGSSDGRLSLAWHSQCFLCSVLGRVYLLPSLCKNHVLALRTIIVVRNLSKYSKGPAHWGLGEIDGLLVPPGKASNLLTDHLITG